MFEKHSRTIFRAIGWLIISILLVSILFSCKAKKAYVNTSTFYKDTIVRSKAIHTDTTVHFKFDTVTIEKERLKVQVYRIFNTDSIFIQADVKPDSATVRQSTTYNTPEKEVFSFSALQDYMYMQYKRIPILWRIAIFSLTMLFIINIFHQWISPKR